MVFLIRVTFQATHILRRTMMDGVLLLLICGIILGEREVLRERLLVGVLLRTLGGRRVLQLLVRVRERLLLPGGAHVPR